MRHDSTTHIHRGGFSHVKFNLDKVNMRISLGLKIVGDIWENVSTH